MDLTEQRLAAIEQRLARIEAVMALQSPPRPMEAQTPAPPKASAPVLTKLPASQKKTSNLTITEVLGWTGAAALVLASVFLIRLALDAGWLTPWRQIDMALIASLALIGTGLRFRSIDQQYASFLPAAGVVVQFCAVYGAHLYHHLIGVNTAAAAVILICLFTLWLGQRFNSELYALFAVMGSCSAPFLLPSFSGSVLDLAVYFSAWSVLFCAHSIWTGNRRPYLLAGYLAFLGFQIASRSFDADQWTVAFSFQIVQFLIFVSATILFSLRQKRPLNPAEAVAHLPLLLIFYALQYVVLREHVPEIAPWIAIASSGAVLLAHFIAQKMIPVPLQASQLLVGSYVSIVLFHAGYMELIPADLAPWTGLILFPLAAALIVKHKGISSNMQPYLILFALVFAVNYCKVMEGTSMQLVAAHRLLALVYAVELYIAWVLSRKITELVQLAPFALYAAHIALMGAAVQILDERLAVSIAWSGIALVSLVLAFQLRDKMLGKSSLLILAASSAKVLLFDLSSAAPLIRIGSLLVLGVTLYVGGWMYKKVEAMDAEVAAK